MVFRVKVNLDGSVARLKAHLVVKGYVQTCEVNYSDTSSPIANLCSVVYFSGSYIRLALALARH